MSTIRTLAAAALVSSALVPAALRAQDAAVPAAGPRRLTACSVPGSGTMYRIKEPGMPAACAPGHAEFSWIDGGSVIADAEARIAAADKGGTVEANGAGGGGGTSGTAGGDLMGTYPNPLVARLQGRALSSAAPTSGQVLGWNGTSWAPTTPASGAAFALPYAGTQTNPGTLLTISNSGTGRAAQFKSTGGVGLHVQSDANAAVHGYATATTSWGVGLRAEHALTTGTALEITRGAIRIAGAGKDTPTAAFWTPTSCGAKYIDSPYANGNPNAIIVVTPRAPMGDDTGYKMPQAWVEYDAAAAKWMLKTSSVASGVCLSSGVNVLIIRN
jgi:hypothetical protein